MTYKPHGVCSSAIDIEVDGDVIRCVKFTGGCNGNLKAIARLVEGMEASRVIKILKGNTCGFKSTSCADQLVKGLKEALEKAQEATE